MDTCPCGSSLTYDKCCGPVIQGDKPASTAEQLMRSRYSAYTKVDTGYLRASLHPDKRSDFDEKSTRTWAEGSEWHRLEIVETMGGGPGDTQGQVEFTATFSEDGVRREHREQATFKKEDKLGFEE